MSLTLKIINRKLTRIGLLLFSILLLIQVQSCRESTTITLDATTKGDNLEWRTPTTFSPEQAKAFQQQVPLAQKHCSHCHEYVAPDLLDRITWPRVLSVMKMHIDKIDYSISQNEWIQVQQFYLQYAAKTFHSTTKKHLPTLQTQFVGEVIPNPENTQNNATLLKYLQTDSTLYLGKKMVNYQVSFPLLFKTNACFQIFP